MTGYSVQLIYSRHLIGSRLQRIGYFKTLMVEYKDGLIVKIRRE